MIVGIALDNWKLNHFRNRLNEAGYTYEDGGPVTHDTTLLRVTTNDLKGLGKLVHQCQMDCAAKGKLS